jgi:hypothetical protein
VSLEAVREAIDACGDTDRAAFARRTRNALAAAILAESLTHAAPAPPGHEPPVDELRSRVGDELGETLAAIYEGGEDWTSRAIDALEPLHVIARR